MILAIGGVVLLALVGGVFWLWLQATHGEVGPAVVATAASLVVMVVALFLALKLQEGSDNEEGRLADGSRYACLHLALPPIGIIGS